MTAITRSDIAFFFSGACFAAGLILLTREWREAWRARAYRRVLRDLVAIGAISPAKARELRETRR